MVALFVYGTLQDPMVLRWALGRLPMLRPARVPGMRAAPLADRPYPGLVADPSSTCRGLSFTVDEGELARLDAFEGPEYLRGRVHAAGDPPVGLEAWRLRPDEQHLALPGTWSLSRFQASADHAGYLAGVAAWADRQPEPAGPRWVPT